MNRAIRRLSIASLVLFVLLMVNVNYLQVFRVNSLASEPYNSRIFSEQLKNQRGEIIAAGDSGQPDLVIAKSKQVKGGFYKRVYPAGREYAPVTGYDSILATTSPFGQTGIEKAENKYLTGTAPSLAVYNLKGLFTGKPKQGASVYLTISPKAQAAAYSALVTMGKPAAAVAIDPRTGAILAMVSYPSFNPNAYTPINSGKVAKNDKRLRSDPADPLLNRAINDTFPPGSTFKLITSSAAFKTGKVANQSSTISAPQFYRLPGSHSTLANDAGAPCGNGNPTILFALTVSCNTAFAKLGVTVGGDPLHSMAAAYGFNNPNLTIPLPVSASAYPALTDRAQIALSAIGQFNDTETPLQEAMVAAAIANGGTMMRPYLVAQIKAPDQSVVQSAQPAVYANPISAAQAGYLTDMMKSVTQDPNGTAYATAGPPATSILIAGKTGTAQNGVNNSHLDDAVFTCFAPADNPKIAVGVIVKGGGFGADAAAPIALKIIQAYLGLH
ncbi:MAG TPA: penicillin-binding transpeptidase domain-containing protein [Streptosporangiaceae bacterium]|nr:penicillin-binding transpeptidase domain-containing protein [Streptosporangiaceae bacterium]